MNAAADQLLTQYESGQISRRDLLLALSVVMAAPAAAIQSTKPPIKAQSLNHVTIFVPDVERAIDFYQNLFGMPVLSRQGGGANLATTSAEPDRGGPPFLGIFPTSGQTGLIHHFALGVEDFDAERITAELEKRGTEPRVRMRDDTTPEIYFRDPDGIRVQLQDISYCGGNGPLGNDCD